MLFNNSKPKSPSSQSFSSKTTNHGIFRMISAHPEYQLIEKKLLDFQGNVDNLTLITQTLGQFRYLTSEEESLKQSFAAGQALRDCLFDEVFCQSQELSYCIKQHKAKFYKKLQKQNFAILKSLKHQRLKICKIFSKMAQYVILFGAQSSRNPGNNFSSIKILYSQSQQQTSTYSKQQVLYILCLMALNLVPQQHQHRLRLVDKNFNWNHTFSYIFSNELVKTQTLLQYFEDVFISNDYIAKFKRQISKTNNTNNYPSTQSFPKTSQSKNSPYGNPGQKNYQGDGFEFVIKRKPISVFEQSQLMRKQTQMTRCDFLSDHFKMQDYILPTKKEILNLSHLQPIQHLKPKVQINFANKHISGGSLTHGMVQQQIIYMNHPQLFATVVLCESLKDNQALYYKGFNKHFKNIGYGRNLSSFQRQDPLIKTLQSHIVAIDAKDYKNAEYRQYDQRYIKREIVKAYAGFSSLEIGAEIVTGNWGCGVFCADHQLKFLVQWIAASLANRSMIYCPYGEEKRIFRKVDKKTFLIKIQGTKVADVYDILLKACKEKNYNPDRFDLIQKISQMIDYLQKTKEPDYKTAYYGRNQVNYSSMQEKVSEMLDQNHQNIRQNINNWQQGYQSIGQEQKSIPFNPEQTIMPVVNHFHQFPQGSLETRSQEKNPQSFLQIAHKNSNVYLTKQKLNQKVLFLSQNQRYPAQQGQGMTYYGYGQFYPVILSRLF